MGFPLLLISDHPQDGEFAAFLKKEIYRSDQPLHSANNRDEVRKILADNPDTVVIWGADNAASYDSVGEIIHKYVKTQRIFAITDLPLDSYAHLFRYPIFGHHILRQYTEPARTIYGYLAQAAIQSDPFGLERFFAVGTKVKKIEIAQSNHKRPAIEAIQNFLVKQGLRDRLSAVVAQATDELLLNAIFDAPQGPGAKIIRKEMDRSQEVAFLEGEKIEVEFASADQYMGIAVTDFFGSLKKKTILDALRKHYLRGQASIGNIQMGVGLGLYGSLQSGVSLIFVSKPRVKTQVMILFPKAENYRAFKAGFRFLSLMSE